VPPCTHNLSLHICSCLNCTQSCPAGTAAYRPKLEPEASPQLQTRLRMSGATSPPPFALTACTGQQPLHLLFGTEKCEGDRMQVSDLNCNYTFISSGLPPDTAALAAAAERHDNCCYRPGHRSCRLLVTGRELFDEKLKVHDTDCGTVQAHNCATVQAHNCATVQAHKCATVQAHNCATIQAQNSRSGNFCRHCSFCFILSPPNKC